jgi:DnaJ like chaperone protein
MAKSFKRHSDAVMRERLLEILATLCLLIHGTLKGRQLASLTRIAEALNVGQLQWQAIKSRYQAASPALDTACCYALLELYPNSSKEQVRTAYRALVKKYHPDLVPQLDHAAQQRHVERMTLINAAYETIRAERGIK